MRPYHRLVAWQKAHALTLSVYETTQEYPRAEQFGLVAQTRRAAASVPANIAEGCGRRSKAQLRSSADIATGSLSELEYWLLLALDLGYLAAEDHGRLRRDLVDVRRLLAGLAGWASREPLPTPHSR